MAASEKERGAGLPIYPLNPYQMSINVQYGRSGGIVQGTGADWFGPLNPLAPIAPPEVRGRVFDFPAGYNAQVRPRGYEPVGFATLRALADSYDLLRLVIETRKDQLTKQDWIIRPKIVKGAGKKPPKAPSGATQSKIDDITKLFARPDGVNRWRHWFRQLLEDLFVIDAPTLFCQRARGGQLLSLTPLDGATIKRVIDDWGRTPQPYKDQDGKLVTPPAYQQVLKGFQAVDYTARDLVYKPQNLRAHKAYGYSPVEQIIMTVNIALRRQMFTLAYYTEGNVPEALIGTPDTWTPQQIGAFQEYWDTQFVGNLAERRHAKFVPGGVANKIVTTKEPELKNLFDEWLAKVVCFAFSISVQPLSQQMNRATAQAAKESAEEEGLEPVKAWGKELHDDVIEVEFDAPELEFAWAEEQEIDPEKQETILTGYTKAGGITINEMRDELGRDKSDDPAADKLMVLTATGMVPIDANTIDGKQANLDAFGPPAPPPGAVPPGGAIPGKGGGSPNRVHKPAGKMNLVRAAPKKPNSGKGVGKAAAAPFVAKRVTRWRSLGALKYDRPAVRKATKAIKALYIEAFGKAAKAAAAAVRKELGSRKSSTADVAFVGRGESGRLAKADDGDKRARQMAERMKLDPLDKVQSDVEDALAEVASDAGQGALAQLGVDDRSELVDQVNTSAAAIARDNAAELVSGIDETTRDSLRDLIAQGLEDNIGTDEIAASIADAYAFSPERAELIAKTEVADANSEAAVEGYRAAKDAGVAVKKEWLLGGDPCDICQANADQGPIDVDDDFESGDDAPTAHPRCECAVGPVVEDGQKDTEE